LRMSSSRIAFQMLTPVGALTVCGIFTLLCQCSLSYYDEALRPMLQGNHKHSAVSS
jgi:hypothetical protein